MNLSYIDSEDTPLCTDYELDEGIGRVLGYEYMAVLGL